MEVMSSLLDAALNVGVKASVSNADISLHSAQTPRSNSL